MSKTCMQFFRFSHCTSKADTSPKALYRHLIRQCEKLPEGPQKYYKFMIKQSFKQHVNETDPQRIQQIVARSYEDADWVLKKYLGKQ
ncbi:LYR motif-containing protein 9 [Tribolium castaneum]|uniref:LYR motif-containing protein 9 n=1 Tax=Tribolium castaneum TaxID=7070 RepID=UPI0001758921